MKCRRLVVLMIICFACLSAAPRILEATSWIELSEKYTGDSNVYAYVTPYHDAYSATDLKVFLKDKFSRSTHYSLNYAGNLTSYSELTEKNYISNQFSGSLEEDLSGAMVANLSFSGMMYDYSDETNSMYDYFHFTGSAALRFFIFAFNFTSIDWGLEYGLYTLPNYNFADDGYTPSLSFLEEVAEYSAFGTFLTVKQALGQTLDLELTGKILSKYCPERPLFASTSTGSYPDYMHYYLDEKRSDLESTINIGLKQQFLKNSYVKLSYCITTTRSNANAQAWDTSLGDYRLFDDYYNQAKGRAILDAMVTFGKEYSFVRLYATYTNLDFDSRNAQNQGGDFSDELRKDEEISVLLELNQRLGYLGKTSWTLRLAYQYTQNLTNDYYYNFNRETITLGLSAALYL